MPPRTHQELLDHALVPVHHSRDLGLVQVRLQQLQLLLLRLHLTTTTTPVSSASLVTNH
jgi:hypothetical protein